MFLKNYKHKNITFTKSKFKDTMKENSLKFNFFLKNYNPYHRFLLKNFLITNLILLFLYYFINKLFFKKNQKSFHNL